MKPSQAASRPDFWTEDARKRLRRGGLEAPAAWDAYWQKRRPAATLERLLHAEGTPLAWGWNLDSLTEESRAVVDLADELARGADPAKFAKPKRQSAAQEALAAWVESARDGDTNVGFGLGCLAAAHVLHQLGGVLDASIGWQVLDFLVATAEEAAPWGIDVDGPAGTALAQQLVAGELPLTLAYCFPEMAPLAALRRPGRKQLADGLVELTGDAGLVRAGHLDVQRGLLACWTRCRVIVNQLDRGAWRPEAQSAFETAVRQSIRWTDATDGRPLFSTPSAAPWTADFLAALLRAGGRKADAAAARALLAETPLAAEIPAKKAKLPVPSMSSDSAALAVLRTGWSPRAVTCSIDWSALGMRIHLNAGGRLIASGVWGAMCRANETLLKPTGDWESVCWFTDRDVDYIEFELPLENGARLERQALLARGDGFLLLVDSLQSPEPALLEHACQLPLADNLTWRPEVETRDASIVNQAGAPVARLLPLALPEWRIDPRMGALACTDRSVRLEQRTTARAVACPLFIDLLPKRVAKPCTWRQLTVAEGLAIQPPDTAVAYRVQAGKKQWAFYRSLGPRGNRTFLGQNTSSEFFAGRFVAPEGTVEQLVQVDG